MFGRPGEQIPVAGAEYRAMGPALAPSLFVQRGGVELGPLWVAKPLHWDAHQRPERPPLLFSQMGEMVYSGPMGLRNPSLERRSAL